MNRTAQLLATLPFLLAGCNADASLPTGSHLSHEHGLSLASLSRATDAQTLAALTQLTAPFHDLENAQAKGYGLFKSPLTAPDGCISSAQDGGMGYHYTRGNNLADDSVSLLDPEFLVYAPKNGPRKDGEARTRLAALRSESEDVLVRFLVSEAGELQGEVTVAQRVVDAPVERDLVPRDLVRAVLLVGVAQLEVVQA